MPKRMFLRPFGAAIVALSLLVGGAAAGEDMAGDARQFIERSAADVRATAPAAADIGARQRHFETILGSRFDIARIGRFVLGNYWDSLSETQRADFLAAFRSYVVKSYADRFFTYAGQPMTVIETRSTGEGQVVVRTTVRQADGNGSVPVDWKVERSGPDQRIVDVTIDGVSLTRTQRDEFASVIRSNGGDVGKLTAMLRQRAR